MNYETQEEFEHFECGEETMIGERETSDKIKEIIKACKTSYYVDGLKKYTKQGRDEEAIVYNQALEDVVKFIEKL